ncbi:MAG TPA: hypothetical protein PK830_04695 [Candidatus Atribacteria bacterium]|mgnify:CR=1 FL=1|nr:hypothetical protein [Candidatus Atribacteria bacterium]HPT78384.1 hypothetical protein [Candidatus Atribacteria bacterium]
MFYLLLVMAGLGAYDIMQMRAKKQTKQMVVYIVFMLLVGIFGIFYFSDPDRTSFAKLVLTLIGRKE